MVVIAIVVLALLAQHPETLSLLGDPLYPPGMPKAERAQSEATLATARAAYEKRPADPAAIIAFEQASLALGRVGDALEILTHGLEANPDEPRLLLERGRSLIRIRKFEPASRDLRKAAATLPAAKCALGLSTYLGGDFSRAREAYAGCANPGVFGYLSARRSGAAAPPRPAPTGDAPPSAPAIRLPGSSEPRKPEQAAVPIAARYMDAIEQLLEGKAEPAAESLKKIVEKYRRNDWMEPAYIAAEVDYARLVKDKPRGKKGKR